MTSEFRVIPFSKKECFPSLSEIKYLLFTDYGQQKLMYACCYFVIYYFTMIMIDMVGYFFFYDRTETGTLFSCG